MHCNDLLTAGWLQRTVFWQDCANISVNARYFASMWHKAGISANDPVSMNHRTPRYLSQMLSGWILSPLATLACRCTDVVVPDTTNLDNHSCFHFFMIVFLRMSSNVPRTKHPKRQVMRPKKKTKSCEGFLTPILVSLPPYPFAEETRMSQ